MINPIKAVYAFNKSAGLLETGYSCKREAAFQIEEAIEGFDLTQLCRDLGIETKDSNAKEVSRHIMKLLTKTKKAITEVECLDKSIDAFIFSVGAMAKMGLTPQQIAEAVLIVNHANQQKLGGKIDSKGKLGKPIAFVGPEKKLQALLDKRRSV